MIEVVWQGPFPNTSYDRRARLYRRLYERSADYPGPVSAKARRWKRRIWEVYDPWR